MTRAHILDQLSLGKIVQIRERLLHAQASGKRVYRLESGDPSFSVAPHVLAALQQAAQAEALLNDFGFSAVHGCGPARLPSCSTLG